MVGYSEVFPWADVLSLPYGGEKWAVDVMHCIVPDCPCTQSILRFQRVRTASGPSETHGGALFVRYDDATGACMTERTSPGCPDPRDLLRILRSAHPGLNAHFRERRRQLKRIGRRQLPEYRKTDPSLPRGDKFAPLDTPSLQPLMERPAPAIPQTKAPRPGRNDPCPCGSGKKFKKCCGF